MLRFLDSETNFASPKKRKQMSANELRYLDEKAPKREREVWRSRARSRAQEAAIDLAAEALIAQVAREAGEQ